MTSRKEDGYNKLLPTRIREIMSNRKVKQKDLSEKTGIARQSIGYYMNGSNVPDAEKLALIAKALNVSSDYLIGLTDEERPSNSLTFETSAEVIRCIEKILQKEPRSNFSVDDENGLVLSIYDPVVNNYFRMTKHMDTMIETSPESTKQYATAIKRHALHDLIIEAKKNNLDDYKNQTELEANTISIGNGILLDLRR